MRPMGAPWLEQTPAAGARPCWGSGCSTSRARMPIVAFGRGACSHLRSGAAPFVRAIGRAGRITVPRRSTIGGSPWCFLASSAARVHDLGPGLAASHHLVVTDHLQMSRRRAGARSAVHAGRAGEEDRALVTAFTRARRSRRPCCCRCRPSVWPSTRPPSWCARPGIPAMTGTRPAIHSCSSFKVPLDAGDVPGFRVLAGVGLMLHCRSGWLTPSTPVGMFPALSRRATTILPVESS